MLPGCLINWQFTESDTEVKKLFQLVLLQNKFRREKKLIDASDLEIVCYGNPYN